MKESDIFNVVGYMTSGSSFNAQTKNEKQLVKGRKILAGEVARTFSDLPQFIPATRNGEPVASSMVKMVFFKLE